MDTERDRILSSNSDLESVTPWYLWGPYVSERAWGTVRESYGPDDREWNYFPHKDAHRRAYRWNEDGMAAVCDVRQRLCLGLALWNGQDDCVKERMFGLANPDGNHGEDVKEYYWYVDALPSHAWLKWRYHYPRQKFPHERLLLESRERKSEDPRAFEFELLDTGVFEEDRYWIVEVTYAKVDRADLLMRITAYNAGPEKATLHVLPTLWFRNTWSWHGDGVRPAELALSALSGGDIAAEHPDLGHYRLHVAPQPGGEEATLLFCENESNGPRDPGPGSTSFPKDGINDRVVRRRAEAVNPARVGSKAAAWFTVEVGSKASVELRLRLRVDSGSRIDDPLGNSFSDVMDMRRAEADRFYDDLAPSGISDDQRRVMRQAYAGMIWCKQFYSYHVDQWLSAREARGVPRESTAKNSQWRHLVADDVLSMPDKWEFPWFALWDLAFQAVVFAHIDPVFAKRQLELLCSERYQRQDGALPGCEWEFDEAHPPVHAWATLKVWRLDGCRDYKFLKRVFARLLLNFTWWVERKDSDGNNLFEGGFLGLDNISLKPRPVSGWEQADATGWMGFYCLSMLEIALQILRHDPEDTSVEQQVRLFIRRFKDLRQAINGQQGLWDADDHFFYDREPGPDGRPRPVKIRSLVGLVPVLATSLFEKDEAERFWEELRELSEPSAGIGFLKRRDDGSQLLSMLGEEKLPELLRRYLLNEAEFLSTHGLRSLSAAMRDPIEYVPAEAPSIDVQKGGNSNWRGPIWMPLNYLLIDTLAEFGERLPQLEAEFPTGSGSCANLLDIAADLRSRLIALFLPDNGRRPCYGEVERLQTDPKWSENTLFFEYFHGDNGAGLGASHQTGWTGLVADLICGLRGVAPSPAHP